MKRVILFTFQDEQSIEALKSTEVINVALSKDWSRKIINYQERSVLPDNRVKARKIN